MLLASGRAAVLVLALAACSPKTQAQAGADAGDGGVGESGEPCPVGYLGVEGGAPDFDFQVLLADDTVAALSDGDAVPMILPPQGGRVIFVGVRATNVDGCGVQITGALRDLATQQVRLDSRTVNLVDTGDGYGVSGTANTAISAAIANFSNIPVCPNEWASTNVYGNVFGLEVTIQDREGRQLTKKIHVTPQCGEPANLDQCLCICSAGYVLGQPCADAGGD